MLINVASLDRVRDGDAWFVKLSHREFFAIADPIERVTRATLESTSLNSSLADPLARAKPVVTRRESVPAVVDAGARTDRPAVDGAAMGERPFGMVDRAAR